MTNPTTTNHKDETLELVKEAAGAIIAIDGIGDDVSFIAGGIAALAGMALGDQPKGSFEERRAAMQARLSSLSDRLHSDEGADSGDHEDHVEGAPV